MSIHQLPKIVTSDLAFYYDMPNGKSFVGGPVTNTLDGASVNGYPTYGNGWGTYNTNNYGSGTYFSIGTITSVSGNIVTTSAAHPLRSYDVMQPQTTGGGVTAGTNYLIKKLSSTTFSLHPYNGSQDGSQGYINPATGTHKVYDDFANNVQISINSSSFPTMWWGYPHLPNSGLVKELIPGGFTGLTGRPPTDCIRLHFIRPDNVTDGMAYGPLGQVVANQTYTVSFWTRSVTVSAVGNSLSYQIYNYGVISPAGYSFNALLGPVGVWTKQQMTFTPVNPYCISYFFPSTGSMKCDVANIQFEVGAVANNFAPGTRSPTQALLDLTNKNAITVNNLTCASDGTFSFNGASSIVNIGPSTRYLPLASHTLEAWIKSPGLGSGMSTSGVFGITYGVIVQILSGGKLSYYVYNTDSGSSVLLFLVESTGVNLFDNKWHHITCTRTATTASIYIDGVLNASVSGGGSWSGTNIWSAMDAYIGYNPNNIYYWANGFIASAKIYNRALSATEILQNFQALRGRYGI